MICCEYASEQPCLSSKYRRFINQLARTVFANAVEETTVAIHVYLYNLADDFAGYYDGYDTHEYL